MLKAACIIYSYLLTHIRGGGVYNNMNLIFMSQNKTTVHEVD